MASTTKKATQRDAYNPQEPIEKRWSIMSLRIMRYTSIRTFMSVVSVMFFTKRERGDGGP